MGATTLDFIGFTYKRKHSVRDLGIYRTNDGGDRYTDNLIPTLTDKTVDVPGGDGQYLFNSFYKSRAFTINFAFDSMTETQLRTLRQVFNGKDVSELIFDETPYKAYDAKVTGTPQLKMLCFDAPGGKRVYKGEGSVQFTCYNPFAHSPSFVWFQSALDSSVANILTIDDGYDSRYIMAYTASYYTSRNEWADMIAANYDDILVNHGELPAPFKVTNLKAAGVSNYAGFIYYQGKDTTSGAGGSEGIYLPNGDEAFTWDSRTGLVTNSNGDVVEASGDLCATLPVGCWGSLVGNSGVIDFKYWYY